MITTSDEAPACDHQHKKPCHDCPWRRNALAGWLGGSTVEEWLAAAHGDGLIMCHAIKGPQCAGAAIYRRNVAKLPHDKRALALPADRAAVFGWKTEFATHHTSRPKP